MYTCGPTVYDSAHVGNFRAFLTYDVLKRVLLYFGLSVNHVCNLTDIDDKIIARCLRDKVNLTTLTLKYEQAFMEDLERLNIVPATRYPRATQHVQDMVDMITSLQQKGLAYQTEDGSWYFSTSRSPGYGQQLVSLSVEDMDQSEMDQDGKQNWQDFCLWKAAKPDEPQDAIWDTEIGRGRPGWHLECSAMARRYLGDTIDVHCGGIDLKFPHHENEIAQSEGSSGKVFCNCWIHNGFVNVGQEKMSKSLGNFLTLSEACPEPNDVRAYRYLVVTSQYRTDLSFTKQAMEASKKALRRMDKVRTAIQETLVSTERDETLGSSDIVEKVVPLQVGNFQAALRDDLSMPRAAACLFALIKAAETELKREGSMDVQGLRAIYDAMDDMDRVFGIFYMVDEQDAPEVPEEVMELVGQRAAAKEAKDWELADSLRARITELGFVVKDVKGGEPIVSPVE
jgi:cysteinyl-tRNA synthetase